MDRIEDEGEEADTIINGKQFMLFLGIGFLALAIFFLGWKLGYGAALTDTADYIIAINESCLKLYNPVY